jgi:steroid delta-isomerase-like uncharacterized protein
VDFVSSQENSEIIHGWANAINAGDIDIAIKFLAPDFAGHFTGMPEPVRSPEGFKQMWLGFIKPSFPDQHITIEQEVTSGNKIAAQTSWVATHQGDFMGIPPTGRQVTVPGTGIFRIEDALIAEEWMQEDFLGIYQQLTQPS